MFKTELGVIVDWTKIEKEDYLLAMERSPVKDIEIKHLLQSSLSDKIDDLNLYMRGIDTSYYYEGYLFYKTKELKGDIER